MATRNCTQRKMVSISGALLTLAASHAIAQTSQATMPALPPMDLPALPGFPNSASNGGTFDQMFRPQGATVAPLSPVVDPPAPAGFTGVPSTTQPVDLIREGSFVVNRTGRLIKMNDGINYQLQLDPTVGQIGGPTTGPAILNPALLAPVESPIGVLPNLTLMKMVSAQRDVKHDLHFNVVGMVTEYDGQNYIELENASRSAGAIEDSISAVGKTGANSSQIAAANPMATTAPANAAKMNANQLLDQMLQPASEPPTPLKAMMDESIVDSTTGARSLAPGAQTMNLRREGTFLIDRTGRLTHDAATKQAEFTFDSDGRSMGDPPIVLLPGLKLESMENAVTGQTRDLKFRITGMITEFQGRNYVLLEKAVVVPDVMQQF